MASITQTIPSFTGGISQQPDELVLPGQVKDLVNGIPDITDGLVKRPGSRFISALSGASAGTWFSYYRDKSEGAYIGQVQRDGAVKIWNTSGSLVHNGSANGYLAHTTDEDLKFLTVADTTFVTNSTVEVQRTGNKSGVRSPTHQVYVELRQVAHGREYSFDVATPSATESALDGNGRGRVIQATLKAVTYPTITRGDQDSSTTYQGIDPKLQYSGSEVLTATGGSGSGLIVRLTVTGQVAVSDQASEVVHGDDYVGIYNKQIEILHGGRGYQTSDSNVQVQMHGVNYGINIVEIQQINVKADLGSFRPGPTTFDANATVSPDVILSKATSSGLGVTVDKIGNGLFLSSNSAFIVTTMQPDLWRITTTEVNDPADLPRQCRHNMIVKVVSSSDSQEDDYYLKFVGDNNGNGPGRWEETIGPDVYTSLDANTMPHIIQRQNNGSFTVGTYNWLPREVGDQQTNPFPSLMKNVAANEGRKISQTFFHRNRLGFLCEDNIILSRAGEPGNFFQESALVIGASDPIDIEASSTQPTLLKNAIETNTGLVVFAETQQFLLHTDSDTLTPETGKVSNISTYRYSPQTAPISLGTTIAFLDSAGRNGRFFEMFDIRREGEPSMVEQTKVVPRLLPTDLTVITNSRENNTVFLNKAGESDIYGYRYFNTGDRRVQSSWFKWTLPFNVHHLFVLDDELYIVQSGQYNLLKIPLQEIDTTREAVGDDFYGDATKYRIHLDSSKSLTAGSYDGTYTEVAFTSAGSGVGTQLAAVNLTTGEVFIEDTTQRSAPSYKFLGDFGGDTVVVGWLYEMKVDLPRIFVKQKAGELVTSDLTASLTIQRVNMRFGPVGQIDVDLKRLGKSTVTTQYEALPMDHYDADEISMVSEKSQQVPVYERNKNCNITLKSFHPGPASFRSMTWEGDYTPMYHKRV
tara:strand:+ start:1887 stop:4649 length:2763 start_codon:yes stop_codon:yes gene_type:complete